MKSLAKSVAFLAMLGATVCGAQESQNDFAQAVEVARQIPPEFALEKAREARAQADQGDGAAAYRLGMMLMMFGRFGPLADAANAKAWNEVAGGKSVQDWMFRSAELGNADGIRFACGMAEDALAPADSRAEGKAACEAGKNQQPAQPKSAG
jgi:hypothetical protein